MSDGAPGGLGSAEASLWLRAEHPANTAATYVNGWSAWASWAKRNGVCALPADPADLASHLAELAAARRRVRPGEGSRDQP